MADDDRELTDREKVDGLRGLVLVELIGAHDLEPGEDGLISDYVLGRIGAYELVLDAIGRRWPELQHWQAAIEQHYERTVGMEPPTE